MAKCKECAREYHACMSCGLWYDWEWEYCGNGICWEESEERKQLYKEHEEKFQWTNEEKLKYIKSIENDPEGSDTTNVVCELQRSMALLKV